MHYMQKNSTIITSKKLLVSYIAKLKKLVLHAEPEELLDALKDSRYPETLLVLRGKKNEYSKLMYTLFIKLLDNYSNQDLLRLFQKQQISETIFIQMMTIFFQMRDKKAFDRILNLTFEHPEQFKNKPIIAEALHIQASWENAITKNFQKALQLNKIALSICRKNGFKLLETKILYGLTHNKSLDSMIHLKLSHQIKDYEKYYKKFLELNDEYRALRALIESYSLRIELAMRDPKKSYKEIEDVHEALLKLLREQKRAENYYLLMFIKRELSKVLMILGQEKKAKQYEKEHQKLKEGFSL